VSRLLGDSREIKEPRKVVSDDKDARSDESHRGQGDERPRARDVLEVDEVTKSGEEDPGKWQRFRKT
jgi:hypothetical protein